MKILLLIVLFAVGGFAQGDAKLKMIIWSEAENCGETARLSEGELVECDMIISNGRRVAILEHNGLQMAVTYGDDGDHLVLNTIFINLTGKRVLIDPQRFVALHYRQEADKTTETTLAIEHAIPPGSLAKKIKRGVMWSNIFTAMAAAAQTRESTLEARTNTGIVITGTESSPNYDAQNRAARENADRSSRAADKAQSVIDGALFPNTVFDKRRVGGYVYFKRNKKAAYTQIGLIIEGTVYIFELRKG